LELRLVLELGFGYRLTVMVRLVQSAKMRSAFSQTSSAFGQTGRLTTCAFTE